jgi:hypothetical protein
VGKFGVFYEATLLAHASDNFYFFHPFERDSAYYLVHEDD